MGLQNEKEYLALSDTLLDFARLMLKKYGEFLPFGAGLKPDGEIVHVGADTGEDSHDAKAVLELLLAGLKKGALDGTYRAAAACIDVKVVDPRTGQRTDAAQVIFEHESGEALDVFVPYSIFETIVPFTSQSPSQPFPA
jgi:hypothetical protein